MKPLHLEALRAALEAAGSALGCTLDCEWVSPACDLDLRVRLLASDGATTAELVFNP